MHKTSENELMNDTVVERLLSQLLHACVRVFFVGTLTIAEGGITRRRVNDYGDVEFHAVSAGYREPIYPSMVKSICFDFVDGTATVTMLEGKVK